MATYYAQLTGGPCDGKLVKVQPIKVYTLQIKCGGWYYVWDGNNLTSQGYAVFIPEHPVAQGGKAAHAHKGWADLQHSVNHVMPKALHRSQRSLAAALRTLHRARKVRL